MNLNLRRSILMAPLLAAVILVNLSGCALLIAGGVAETALILGDRRPLSIVTLDRGIQLEADSIITQKFQDDAHVSVNVFNQKLLLTGEVKSQEMKDQVQSSVSSIKNVRVIANELAIGLPSSTSSRISDASLFSLVKAKLIATSDVPTNSLKITVEAGTVYLMGITTELEAKAAATVASKSSSIIKEVVKLFDIISEEEKKKFIVPTSNEKK